METPHPEIRELVLRAAERAFALSGRFSLYGDWAKKAGHLQIGDLYDRACGYAREHAALLVELSEDCRVPDTEKTLQDTLERLHDSPYARFAAQAQRADMPETGELFQMLGGIEAVQSRCFSILLQNLRQGTAYERTAENYWVCRVCGMLYKSVCAPQMCPVCGMPRESFSLYTEDY